MIRKCFTVCKNRKQAGYSAQHWSTIVLPINTVAAAGAWILAVRRGDGRGRGRPVRRRSAGGRCSLKSRVIQQGYCEYGRQTIEALLLFGGRTARRFGSGKGRRAVARLKYLVIAQSLNI